MLIANEVAARRSDMQDAMGRPPPRVAVLSPPTILLADLRLKRHYVTQKVATECKETWDIADMQIVCRRPTSSSFSHLLVQARLMQMVTT